MDLEARVEQLEAALSRQRERGLANEILANLFYARVLNISEQLDDTMDLDAVLSRLPEDMDEAAANAATTVQADSWRRVHALAATMIAEIRDLRLSYRPANENGGDTD